MLDEKSVKIINDILSKGGSVEVRKRKGEIVILEIHSKVKHTVILKGE